MCLSRSSSGRERLHKQHRNCLEARKVGCPSFQLLPSLYVHPKSGRKLEFLACILLPNVSAASSRPHKQWICFSISAGTGFIAQSTGDDGLDCFQVAFGDECVAVAFQPFPVGRRMSQVICSTRGQDCMGWSEEMVESPRKRVEEEEKVGKESDCRLRGRKSVWSQGFVSWFLPVCRLPPGYLALAESWRGAGEGTAQNQ